MSSVLVSEAVYAYGARPAVQGISLVFQPGIHTVLTGANGSGKSTLLALAAGVLKPQSGTVTVASGRRPAFVIQHTRTSESLPCTVQQAVEMGRWPHRRAFLPLRTYDKTVTHVAMERMGIADLGRRQLVELSGGQRQRTLIAQGLAQEADILILDEPTAGLDKSAHQLIRAAIDQELARGATVIESSHSPEDIERADRVIILDGGRIISDTGASGAPDRLLESAIGTNLAS